MLLCHLRFNLRRRSLKNPQPMCGPPHCSGFSPMLSLKFKPVSFWLYLSIIWGLYVLVIKFYLSFGMYSLWSSPFGFGWAFGKMVWLESVQVSVGAGRLLWKQRSSKLSTTFKFCMVALLCGVSLLPHLFLFVRVWECWALSAYFLVTSFVAAQYLMSYYFRCCEYWSF